MQESREAAVGGSVRLKRPMRLMCVSVRLKRLKGPISSLLHAGSAKLQQIADNTQQGPVPRQERPPV
jgi:hypothetical protein